MVIFESLKLVLLFLFFKTHSVSADLDTIEVNRTRIALVHGPKHENNTEYSLYEGDELGENLSHRYTVMFIPDYYVPQYHTVDHILDEAYLKNGDYDYTELIWGFSTDDPSKAKQPDIKALVPLLAKFIIAVLHQMDRTNFHLLAFSSGVELADKVAREIMAQTDGNLKLARLTALEPPPNCELLINDADFVDAIHSDAFGQGTSKEVAHADFWPNGGITQPGCTSSADLGPQGCSHQRGGVLWVESVANQKTGPQFYSYGAKSLTDLYDKWMQNKLEKPEVMGINCSPNARGNYYLLTKGSSPYALDMCPM